jgi:hypothetical protein
MTTGLDDFDSRIHVLAERENECNDLFEEIKNGNGDKSLRYLELRDSCKELRKDLFRCATSTGLTRETIKTEIEKARTKISSSSTDSARKGVQKPSRGLPA